jgi:hypothetical protein
MQQIQLDGNRDGLAAHDAQARLLWQYHHTPVAAGQPCFHPLNTPAGHTLSLLSPWDHIHHCGLWFSWKLVDGVNVWEGTARPPVESRIVPLALEHQDARFSARYRWERNDHPPLLDGGMVCACHYLEPRAYALDLTYQYTTPGPATVLLDRNPPPQAGYAGLSMRFVRSFRHARYLDADGRSEPPTRGTATAWHTFSGPLDGGPQLHGGVALIEHPDNPRFPAPTYTIHERDEFAFLQSAFLYDAPYTLQPGVPLVLCYRVVVYDGEADGELLGRAFSSFAQQADH